MCITYTYYDPPVLWIELYAGPQYSVTMSTVVLSPNSFTVVWAAPSALINQQLRNFIITVMDLSTAVHYHSSSTVAAQANATTTFFQLSKLWLILSSLFVLYKEITS